MFGGSNYCFLAPLVMAAVWALNLKQRCVLCTLRVDQRTVLRNVGPLTPQQSGVGVGAQALHARAFAAATDI